jgi:hypothetical protein
VDDEIANLRVVDGALRHGLPRLVGLDVVRIDADDVERRDVGELHAVQRFQLSAEDEVEELLARVPAASVPELVPEMGAGAVGAVVVLVMFRGVP